MTLNQEMYEMFADLEYCVGSCCSNDDAYDALWDCKGLDYRYPITLPTEYYDGSMGLRTVRRRSLNSSSSYNPLWNSEKNPESLKYMRYRFGANKLYIGLGLKNILDYLEDRYDLDFNKLEEDYQTKNNLR